jgi:photosynthetic reaction center cytochrome c subunit
VLGDLTEDQFNTLMANISAWVAPQEGDNAGCAYCHNIENMADDGLYTKVVARRMLQMTREINGKWKAHVAATGVTCYTCHRGQPVPTQVWFQEPGPRQMKGWVGWRNGQNVVANNAGHSSLPYNALPDYLLGNRNIRVHTLTALPSGNKARIMDTESTYALMIYISTSLGVNCTFCHNSRAFNEWDQGPSQRVTAWHGIRMVRALNNNYLQPLKGVFPPNRLGPLGDAPNVGCATCHKGVNKPLYGAPMITNFLAELGGATPQ